MSSGIQLISDGEGVLVVGDESDVHSFLESEGLPARGFDITRLAALAEAAPGALTTFRDLQTQTTRWVKVTKQSAEVLEKFGLKDSLVQGLRQVVLGESGDAGKWVELIRSSSNLVGDPAVSSGAAGLMAQAAMEQLVEEIVEYLVVIDKKLDAVLRSQTNQVLARLDAIDLAVKEASIVRETVGRVSDVTWSKVQGSSVTILETQAYALRQLADIAEQIDAAAKVDELAEVATAAEVDVQKWLRVLAICVRLYDSVAVIELDRVMDTAPQELEAHLAGLRASRSQRLELFVGATGHLVSRMVEAADRANSKVLLNPFKSPAIVAASNQVGASVVEFLDVLTIESERQSAEARRWTEAASETWEVVREGSAEGIERARSLTAEARRRALSVKGRLGNRGAGVDSLPVDDTTDATESDG